MAAITVYTVVLFVHVAAVVAGYGLVLAYPAVMAAGRAAGPRGLAAAHRLQAAVTHRLASAGAAVVLAAGLYLSLDGPFGLEEPWVGTTLLILVVLGGLSGGYLGPREGRLAELAEAGGEAYERAAVPVRALSLTASALVLLALFLMITKPGA